MKTKIHIISFVLLFIAFQKHSCWAKESPTSSKEGNSITNDISSLVLKSIDFFEPKSETGSMLKSQTVFKDPDVGRKTPELIESRGFICETHYVTTRDGYILGVHRIVNPKMAVNKRPVILWHGLMASSLDFVSNSPGGNVDEPVQKGFTGNNLGFELSKRGYDVWMGNTRGNIYSRNHTKLDPEKDKIYWDFSFDEFIAYDVPAVVDYVQETTNSSKVGYIGHSQGTAIMFGLLSTQAKYNSIIEPFIALAPVTTVAHSSTAFNSLARRSWFRRLLMMKGGKFLPDGFIRLLARRLCSLTSGSELCQYFIFFVVGGYDSTQLNKTRIAVYAGEESLGTSTKNLVHWAQAVDGHTFSHFDYGIEGNEKKYLRPTPPEYPLEHISCKSIALFYSLKDVFADPQDVQILKNRLRVKLLDDYMVPYKEWSHIDFIWGVDAGRFINQRVLEILSKFTK